MVPALPDLVDHGGQDRRGRHGHDRARDPGQQVPGRHRADHDHRMEVDGVAHDDRLEHVAVELLYGDDDTDHDQHRVHRADDHGGPDEALQGVARPAAGGLDELTFLVGD